MPFTLSNFSKNTIVITNTDLITPMLYTLEKMGDENVFTTVTNFPTLPTNSLLATLSTSIDLTSDGLYKLIIANSPENTEFYFLLDYNLKLCLKEMTEKILCNTCDTKDACKKQEYNNNVYNLLKFNVLKNNVYFIWNKVVQTQSISDVVVAPNGELALLSDLMSKLTLLCNNCNETDNCNDVYLSNGDVNPDCGCR